MKEMKTSKEIMRDLVDRLNYLTLKYDEGRPEVSDKEWDDLYFQLLDMENKAGMYYIDSSNLYYIEDNEACVGAKGTEYKVTFANNQATTTKLGEYEIEFSGACA
jgi:NAD-dependent DNA ligase